MFIYGEGSKLKGELGFWQLTLMGIAGALGAGFFVLISEAITIGGSLTPLAFFVASIGALLMSRVYAELATSMPKAGGGQVYLRNAFQPHPLLFIVHWLTWLAELSFTALNALGAGFYISLLLPVDPTLISLICVVALVVVNLKGAEEVGKIEIFTGAALILSVVGLAALLFQHLPSGTHIFSGIENASAFGWLHVIPLIFVVFIGNEDIAALAAEVEDKKDIAKAFTTVIIGVLVITVLFSFLFSQIFPATQLANNPRPFGLLGDIVGSIGKWLGIAVAILGCVSSLFFGSLADTRTAYAMGKAGEFPKVFAKLNENKVPYISVLVSGVLVALLVSTKSASYVAYLSSAGFLIEVIAISFALMKLRRKRPNLPRPILAKPYPFIPIAVIVIAIIFLLFVDLKAWLALIVFSGLGFLVNIANHVEKGGWYHALIGILLFLLAVLAITALILFI